MSRLPKGWTLERLRYSSRLNPSKTEVRGRSPGEEVSFVPMEAVGELGGLRLDQTRAIGAVESGYSYFRNGDIVVAKITPCFENGKGALAAGLQGGIAFGTTELHVLRPSRRLDARFLFYITLSHPFRALGEAEMYGAGGQKRVPEDFFRDFRTAIPSADIQRAIADFLDRKTAAIDALIAKKERLLELLAEKRQALITQAVTKGLEASVEMKESGVAYLGQLPAHWGVCRVKHVMSAIVDCPHTTPDYSGDGTYPAVRTADLERGRLDLSEARLVSEATYHERVERLVPAADDILYSREGERFGMAALVPPDVKLCLGQRMMIFRVTRDHSAAYFMWALNSESLVQQIVQDTVGATAPRVNIPTITNAWVPRPPVREQQAIVRALGKALKAVEELARLAKAQIALLREYRQALITAAVTGQLDVTASSAAAA